MKAKIKSFIVPTLKVLFAGGLIYWLVQSGRLDFKELAVLLQPGFILAAVLITLINITFASERWRGLLKSRGFNMGFWETLKLVLVGLFFNFVIPGGVGGDVVKGYYLAKDNPNQRLKSVVTIAMDRLLGLFSMLIMALFVMIYDWSTVSRSEKLSAIFAFLCLLLAGFMVFWTLIYSRRFVESGWVHNLIHKLPKAEKTLQLYASFADYKSAKATFFKAITWSILGQIFAILLFVFVGNWLGYKDVSIHTYFFVVPIGFMVTAIPISPAGIGLGQAAFSFLFDAALGTKSNLGASTITAVQICNFAVGLIGAYFYIRMGKKEKKTISIATHSHT